MFIKKPSRANHVRYMFDPDWAKLNVTFKICNITSPLNGMEQQVARQTHDLKTQVRILLSPKRSALKKVIFTTKYFVINGCATIYGHNQIDLHLSHKLYGHCFSFSILYLLLNARVLPSIAMTLKVRTLLIALF